MVADGGGQVATSRRMSDVTSSAVTHTIHAGHMIDRLELEFCTRMDGYPVLYESRQVVVLLILSK